MARVTPLLLRDGRLGSLQVGLLVRLAQPSKMRGACVCAAPLEGGRSYASKADDLPGQEKTSCTDVRRSTMTFEEYRKLKKSMKVRNRISGVPMALALASTSSYINVYLNPHMFEMAPEDVQPILGMDPIMFSVLTSIGGGLAGYLLGGVVFSTMWRLVAKNQFREVQQRDAEFLIRLQKHRFSEVNKYEDDYYGDKIMTLSDYRQWIRKQQKRKEDLKAQTAQATSSKS